MIKLALLGKNIQHSRSPEIYHALYDGKVDYRLLDIDNPKDIPTLTELFKSINGLSITAPYKRHFLNDVEMDDEVRNIGAINCISKRGDYFVGTNTDYLAAKSIFVDKNYKDKQVVLLGDGAMANMFKVLFSKINIDYKQFSRRCDGDLNKISFEQLFDLNNLLIINCCARAFNFNVKLSQKTTFWDMNYSHDIHTQSLSNQLTYVDGYELLYLQAVEAKNFWNFTL